LTTTDDYSWLREVSDRQVLAIDALVAGGTHQEAAAAAGVHRVTVSNWARRHPGFMAEVNRRRGELRAQRTARLRELDEAALELDAAALRTVAAQVEAGDPDAAMKWLRVRKINPVEISGGPTDPDEIIADEVVARQRAAQNKMFGDGLFDTGQSPEQIARDLEEELAEEFAEPEE
jgi:transposase